MKRKRLAAMLLTAILVLSLLAACTQTPAPAPTPAAPAAPGAPADSAPAAEVNWPTRSVEIVVPFAPGGDSDFNARVLAERLSILTGQTFTINNIVGNSGALGTLHVHNADPDGYTMLFNHFAFAINYFVGISSLTYDDMAFASFVGYHYDFTLIAHSRLGITTLSELAELAEENPFQLVYGGTAGAIPLLPGLQFAARGIDVTIVDAGGTAERLAALLGGHVDFTLIPIGHASDHIELGDLVVLEDDIGLDAFTGIYFQMFFPPGTDQAIIDVLNEHLQEIIFNDEDYQRIVYEAHNQIPFFLDSVDGLAFAREVWAEFAQLDWTL